LIVTGRPLPVTSLTFGYFFVDRVKRCSAADMAVINEVVQKLLSGPPAAPPAAPRLSSIEFSPVLNNHISISELWADDAESALTESELVAKLEAMPVAGYRKLDLARLYPLWPRYLLEGPRGQYANISIPVLILSAELDTDTPIAWANQAVSSAYNKAKHRHITIPYGSHNTLLNTPVTDSDKTCGYQLIKQFLDSRQADADVPTYSVAGIDTTCTTRVKKTDFAGETQEVRDFAADYVGNPDIWGVEQAPSGMASSVVASLAVVIAFAVLSLAL
jgi:hypothetical protein